MGVFGARAAAAQPVTHLNLGIPFWLCRPRLAFVRIFMTAVKRGENEAQSSDDHDRFFGAPPG